MDGCIFCAIVAGQAPAEVVYEDERTLAFLDVHPANPGHTLVVPKRHAQDLYALDDADGAAVMATARRVALALRRALAPDGLNLFQTNGRAAYQSVFHFHLHLIPRWWDDGLLPPRRGSIKPDDDRPAMALKIRQALRDIEESTDRTD